MTKRRTDEEIAAEAVERVENIVAHLLCHVAERQRQTRAIILGAMREARDGPPVKVEAARGRQD